jgi:hypothetical protein
MWKQLHHFFVQADVPGNEVRFKSVEKTDDKTQRFIVSLTIGAEGQSPVAETDIN